MARDREELRDEVVANHGAITGKDSVVNTILNLIQDDLAVNHNWRDLQVLDLSQTLSEDAYQITVPTSIQKIEFANLLDSDDNWYKVTPLPLQDFRNLDDGSGTPVPDSTSALPTHAHLLGSVFTFNKQADKDYTVYLDAFSYPTAMTADTDYPSITVADNIFIAYATAWLYHHRKQPQTAKTWFAMADTFFKSITNKDHGVNFEFTRKQMGI